MEDTKSPVLLIAVTKIPESPSSSFSGTASGHYHRPPKSTPKKRFTIKSFFGLENFFNSKRSESSIDHSGSSKYRRLEFDGHEIPVFADRPLRKLKDLNTPDLLNLPFANANEANATPASVSKSESTANGAECKVNGVESSESRVKSEVRDAFYFLDLERRQTERLLQMAATADVELEALLKSGAAGEEALGLLRAAAGKARLLATQKMQQFKGLCYKHVNRREGEQFPTTLQDLQGFWDMVCLQVRNVERLFEELAALRNNEWREPAEVVVARPRAAPTLSRRRPPAEAPPRDERARKAADKREADRRAMLEHRRRLARERQLASKSGAETAHLADADQEVEIFVGGADKVSAS